MADKYAEFQQRVKTGEDPKIVLDSLGLKRYCCRRIMITSMDIVDQLMPYNEVEPGSLESAGASVRKLPVRGVVARSYSPVARQTTSSRYPDERVCW